MITNKEVDILNYMNPDCREASDPKFLLVPLNNVLSTKKRCQSCFFLIITEGKKYKAVESLLVPLYHVEIVHKREIK